MFNTWTIYIDIYICMHLCISISCTYLCISICMYIMYRSLYIFWDTTLVTSPSTTIFANQKPVFNPTAIHHATTVKRPFHGTVLRRWRRQTYTSLVASIGSSGRSTLMISPTQMIHGTGIFSYIFHWGLLQKKITASIKKRPPDLATLGF